VINIREANKSDYKQICQLVTSEQELSMFFPKGRFPFSVDQLEQLAEVRHALTVLTENERVVGFADLYNLKPAASAFIGNVIISPESRRRGFGKLIVNHMLELIFRVYQLPEARISVFNSNTPALLLYHRLGFVPYAMEERCDHLGQRLVLLHLHKHRDSGTSASGTCQDSGCRPDTR